MSEKNELKIVLEKAMEETKKDVYISTTLKRLKRRNKKPPVKGKNEEQGS
jgi:hypothetical protein